MILNYEMSIDLNVDITHPYKEQNQLSYLNFSPIQFDLNSVPQMEINLDEQFFIAGMCFAYFNLIIF